MKQKTETTPLYEVNRKIRGDWGSVKPYTRVFDDKRKKKPKHKGKEEHYDY